MEANQLVLDPFYGAVEKEDARDFRLGADTSFDIEKAPFSVTNEYNQLEFKDALGSNLCTAYAVIGMLSDLVGREITETERKEIAESRHAMPDFDPAFGGYLVEGNNCVRKWWNGKNPNNQVRQFAMSIDDPKFMEALEKGYRVNIGYRGNAKYNADAADGTLDDYSIGSTTYGHSTTVKMRNGEVIVDSYKGLKPYNVYSIKDFQKFLSSGIVFKTAYVFLFANDAIDAEIALLKEKHKDSGVTFNADKIKELREKIEANGK